MNLLIVLFTFASPPSIGTRRILLLQCPTSAEMGAKLRAGLSYGFEVEFTPNRD